MRVKMKREWEIRRNMCGFYMGLLRAEKNADGRKVSPIKRVFVER